MRTKIGLVINPLFIILFFLVPGCDKEEEVKITDADRNVYTSVTIGTQVWMTENLKTTKYNDGTAIPNVTEGNAWKNLITPAYCWYDNDISKKNPYGALYNAYAVTTDKLCPLGWHVPSHSEWDLLLSATGDYTVAGNMLKESGTSHWLYPNTQATDDFGFKALPGGKRDLWGNFISLGYEGIWWTSTPGSGDGLNGWHIRNDEERVYWDYGYNPIHGFSVRCIKD
jgi:uncharacterized protein (TIGR02145 family)